MNINLTLFENALLESILNNDFDLNQLSTLSFFDVVERVGKLPTELTDEEVLEYATMVANNLANAIEEGTEVDLDGIDSIPMFFDDFFLGDEEPNEVGTLYLVSKNEEDLPEELWETTEYVSFSEALAALQEGKKIKRKNWEGYHFLSDITVEDFAGHLEDDIEADEYAEDIILARLANGSIAPATYYQQDILAFDWLVLK